MKKIINLMMLIYAAWRKVGTRKLTLIMTVTAGKDKESNSEKELEKVAVYAGITSANLKLKTRKRDIVEARQVAMYLARRNTKESLAKIGRTIGNKDHATVLHSCKTVENLLEQNRQFREKWEPLIMPQ